MMTFTVEQIDELLEAVKQRFLEHTARHPNTAWADVEAKLIAQPHTLQALYEMEQTGGEPDIVELDGTALTFYDCAKESPAGRRSVCYDDAALQARKKNKPANSAVQMAKEMCVELLTEAQYRALQAVEPFDLKTSSWVETPEAIRTRGGAIFCDCRYGAVFMYHNGADSYYAARGFRAALVL